VNSSKGTNRNISGLNTSVGYCRKEFGESIYGESMKHDLMFKITKVCA